jgi:uncharacterized protein YbjT (DUF2867 family)
MRKICLLGGTGFVGRHLATRLHSMGWHIHIPTRRQERHPELQVLPSVSLISCNIYDQKVLNAQLAECEAVVNLVGILNENGHNGQGFRKTHVDLPLKITTACHANGIRRVLHLSALGADARNGKSHYLRTKGEGEDVLHRSREIDVTIFRPSVIFGKDDAFLKQFAFLLKLFPGFFLLPCADARLAPVWIEDVIEAMVTTLDDEKHYGKRYNLCGPSAYTLKELVEYVDKLIGTLHAIIPLSDKMSRMEGRFLDFLPPKFKFFSTDNYNSLQADNVCDSKNDLWALNIKPHSIESIMPKEFIAPDERALYDKFRSTAGR